MKKRVAVVGGGIGGLSAAGELALAGHDVVLFEGSDTLGGKAQRVEHQGLVLDTGPTLLTMPSTVEATFARLQATDLLPRFHRLPLQTDYRFADGGAFSCWEDLERTVASADALIPTEGERLRSFYRSAEQIYLAAGAPYLEAPFDGFASFLARALKRGVRSFAMGLHLATLDSLARQHFRSPQLQQFVGRFATYAGGSPYEASAAFAMIPHLERSLGVHHVEGGMGALVAALSAAVRRVGVEVRLRQPARWNRQGREWIVGGDSCDAVVVNRDPLAVLGRDREPLAMSGYVFFVKAAQRLQLPHHLILFAPDARTEFDALFSGRVPESPTVYVCHPAATDPSMAPEGQSGLFVMVNAPAFTDEAQARLDWPAHAERLQAFCLKRLRRHFPELNGVELEVFGERTPLDLAARGAPGGSIYGFLPHGRLGPFRRPHLKGPEQGLFFAGGGTHPGGGVPLVMLSGHFAAGLALEHLGGRA